MPLEALDYANRDTLRTAKTTASRTASYVVFAVGVLLLLFHMFAPPDYRTGEVARYLFWAVPFSAALSGAGMALAAISLAKRRGGWIPFALNAGLMATLIFLVVQFLRSPLGPGG